MTRSRMIRVAMFVLLVLLALAVRLFGAWCYRDVLHPDSCVVALMAKHMAEGTDFPIFYYGQGYMGSLEPAVSAIFMKLFGATGFCACLGTSFFGFLLLIVLFAWGRSVGGVRAGVASVLVALVGTGGYFHYLGSPRGGGYAAMLFLGMLLLWLSARVIAREQTVGRQSAWWFLLLGFVAGVGWWTSQLISAALISVAVLFILFFRHRVFTWRIVPGLVGFGVGSLPLWIWNLHNGWATFSFLKTPGITLSRGLGLLGARMYRLMDFDQLPTPWRMTAIVLYSAAVVVTLVGFAMKVRKDRKDPAIVYIAALFIFVVVFSLIFSVSHFARMPTPRYALPLVPAVALFVGLAMAAFSRRLPYGLNWVPVLLLVGIQVVTVLPGNYERGRGYDARMRDLHEFGDFLRSEGIEAVYTPYYGAYSRNFLLEEEFCFTDLASDRYHPYVARAEASENIGVLDDYADLLDFLVYAGGSARRAEAGGMTVFYDFTPPEVAACEISPENWKSASNARGDDVRGLVADRNIDTHYHHPAGAEDEFIQIDFESSAAVTGIRLTNPRGGGKYPVRVDIQGRGPSGNEWRSLVEPFSLTGYIWSGKRPYWAGIHGRAEFRFEPTMLSAIRLRFSHDERVPAWSVAELQVLAPCDDAGEEGGSLVELADLIESRGINHVYSDRWLANALDKSLSDVVTEIEPLIVEYYGLQENPPANADWFYFRRDADRNPPNILTLNPHVALVVEQGESGVCRDVLEMRGVSMRETTVGPWVLFDFGPDQWREEFGDDLAMYWAGYACFLRDAKPWAGTLVERAERAIDTDGKGKAEELLRQAFALNPNSICAVERLAELLQQSDREQEAGNLRADIKARWRPDIPAGIQFENGVEFLGLSITQKTVQGSTIPVRYYWRCPPTVDAESLATFIHMVADGHRLQDDHVLLEGVSVGHQKQPEVFVEERRLHVPGETPEGVYRFRLGLYERDQSGRRLRPTTAFPVDSRAVAIPVELVISAE